MVIAQGLIGRVLYLVTVAALFGALVIVLGLGFALFLQWARRTRQEKTRAVSGADNQD